MLVINNDTIMESSEPVSPRVKHGFKTFYSNKGSEGKKKIE